MSLERYSTEMNGLFSDKSRIARWIDVEIALLKAHVAVGNLGKDEVDLKELSSGKQKVTAERVAKIEAEIHHDLMAVVKALAEQCPKSGKFLHIGATSYDIEDTATAVLLRDGFGLIDSELDRLLALLKAKAEKHADTVCIGRTHGQHAVPTTYGMKFALYYSDFRRSKDRLDASLPRMCMGKMSGAVGTMAGFGKKGIEIEKLVMKELGLTPAPITNQVIQRDIHATALFQLAIIASCIEKVAKEFRNLQRTEIGELLEGFSKKQVGSSTMPHKRNPHKTERLCSLARLVRNNVAVALENIALEHERDLTNSANERFIIPESFIVTHYMLKQLVSVLESLVIFEDRAEQNIWLTKGLVFAERLMLELTAKGMDRQKAHELVRVLAQEAHNTGKDFRELCAASKEITALISEKELKLLFDPRTYLGCHRELIRRALK